MAEPLEPSKSFSPGEKDGLVADLSDNDVCSDSSQFSSRSRSKKKTRSKRSRVDILEKQLDEYKGMLQTIISNQHKTPVSQYDSVSSRRETVPHGKQYDSVLSRRETVSSADHISVHDRLEASTPGQFDSDEEHCSSDNNPLSDKEDTLSLTVGQREKNLFKDDDDVSDVDTSHLSIENQSILAELFGEEARPKSVKKTGLCIESTQKEMLSTSWHTDRPDKLTAFQESTKDSFPLDEDADVFLNVPSLDPLVETLLIKKHGSRKATFSKSGATLVTQPFKTIERTGYLGQVSAKIGLASLLYTQKALGGLLELLKGNDPNIDKAIQSVRDIFVISQRTLDQFARCGAFHHLIRRKATIADTGILDFLENTDLNLPLSSDGLFGKGLEDLLQERKDRNKKIEELVPDLVKKSTKRKSYFSDNGQQTKRFKPESVRFAHDSPLFRSDRKFQSFPQRSYSDRPSKSFFDKSKDFKKPSTSPARRSTGRGRNTKY